MGIPPTHATIPSGPATHDLTWCGRASVSHYRRYLELAVIWLRSVSKGRLLPGHASYRSLTCGVHDRLREPREIRGDSSYSEQALPSTGISQRRRSAALTRSDPDHLPMMTIHSTTASCICVRSSPQW